jgi:hypothetical protein
MDTETQTQPDPTPASEPAPVLHYWRAVASEARRFYYGMTRENVASFLKTIAWAVPLTILIWVYAESEQQVPATDVPIAIVVKSRDPAKIVTLERGVQTITCDLVGPRSNLDRFKASLSPASPIVIDLDTGPMSDREDYIPTLDKLSDNQQIKDAGITVEKCDPAMLPVYVDTLEKRSLPVKAPADVPVHDATFDPPTVSASGPRRFLILMDSVVADISTLPELNVPGAHPPLTVSLLPDPSGTVTYDPNQVKATLTVAQKDVTDHINVNILLAVSPQVSDGYSITPKYPVIPQLDVSGPPDEIAKLKDKEVIPHALLEIDVNNLNTPSPVPLTIIGLPPGVHVDGPTPTMAFTATSRQ